MAKHSWLVVAVSVALIVLSTAYTGFAVEFTSCGFLTQRTQCGDLACDKEKNICIRCSTDAECYPNRMFCNQETGQCELKGLFSSFNFSALIVLLLGVLVCAVAVIAGIGGGGILVPMFTALLSVPMKTAVGLSQSTICGQSSFNVYLLVQKKYPDQEWDRPLINYQYLSLLLPLGLIGAHFGGVLSKVCPDIYRLILLFALLSVVLLRTLKRLREQYAQDQAENNQEAVVVSEERATDPKGGVPVTASADTPVRVSQEQYPKDEIIICVSSFFLLLFFEVLMRVSSCGGFFYWLFVLLPVFALIYIFYRSWKRLEGIATETPDKLTFVWNTKSSIYYPLVAVFAGAAAAMLGLGGGLVLGFVLYESLTPEEASATSGVATFFISFSSAIPQIISGILPLDYCVVLFAVGLGATALGQFVIMDYIRKNGLRYLIVASLAFVLSSSLVILGGYGIYNAVIVSRSGASLFAFGKLCGVKLDA